MRREFLILGATLAVTALVAPATAVAASTADRLAGTDRYDTAIQIADEFKTSDVVYLARGDNQADAVAGGKLKNGPLLLVNEGSRTREAVAAEIKQLKAKHVVVLGGVGAVSDDTVKAVAGNADILRISGANRFETAVEISKALTNNQTAAKVYLANGMTLVDALAGGTIPDNAPILLTDGSGSLPSSTVAEIKRLKPTEIVALGGARAVKTDELNAASRVNGSGGGLSQDAAVKKVTADLAKELREADMQLKGWFTVAKDVNLNQFMDSGCVAADGDKEDKEKAEKKATLKAAIEMTYPRVMPSEVNEECDKRIFQVDGATSDGSLAEAKAKAQMLATVDGHGVATFMGLEKSVQMAEEDVKKTAEAAKTEAAKKAQPDTKKEKEAADSAILKAGIALSFEKAKNTYREVNDAFKDIKGDKTSDKVKQLIQAAMGGGGAKTSRIAGNDRYQTALEIAKTAFPSGGNAKAVYVANGTASADATVAGFIDNKAELAGPVLLVKADTVPAEIEAYLKAARQANSTLEGKFKALGGAMVISDTVVDTVKGLLK
ncbi:cell wall-binding repeat-containing protein [Mobiluncus mulieris]|uniref:cell wall-binding repeat-containing protein n=1 Tax=Mobiluncus mulieris TaxID=2052 RepID=UPI00146FCCF1|nr:cell wall-binding repeat-containing protein [Mobiluncus mulieris]MCU9976530.1 cell wall-binding repeat-containing protein [Mobiluncus mulieris]MCV0014883.1 cell wall-binding repeat-containing protein [Mobiluncus mulieris]NMW63691.1 cell wall-binding repeat-containing protein [Mobiluncus mulieris]